MKTLSIILFMLHVSLCCFGQSEFKTHSNGLIYGKQTMAKLKFVVDSLNLKYKYCDLNKTFYAKEQTIGHYVSLEKGNIKQAKKDMKNNISFKAFIKKYPETKVTRQALIVKFKYKDYYTEDDQVEFAHINLTGNRSFSITKDGNFYNKDLKNTWLFRYYKKSEYYEESISAFFFANEFARQAMPKKYARMIGYADCLIDTTTVKFKKNAKRGPLLGLPAKWQSFSQEKQLKLLDRFRSIRVVGGCSRDRSPRKHAANIALISAQATQWNVFLRAHLDIMNDRFDRVTDGSYAYGERKTYIRELEELDINISDLIFGIVLRVENPATNHYYGSIRRVGRALSETKHRKKTEELMLSIIEDNKLDDYNRVMAYFLFLNYDHHSAKANKAARLAKLKKSVAKLPGYIKSKIAWD